MSPTKSWRPLPLPSSADMPVLLVSMNTEAAAYTVHITDMANMWTESLDRKAICIRGWGENTSIDPSDTPDNMTKFLTSLQSALDLSHPSNYESKLHLMKASQADAGDDGLTLQITCELPGLQPLKWPMHLKKAPASAVAADLVLPLVQANFARHKEVESLMSILTQKDAVLNRVLDKLDAMGTGLEHVFNHLSGKKNMSRAAAADKVPGLAPFNRRNWKSNAAGKENSLISTGALVTEVFGEGLIFETAPTTNNSPQLDEWWREFTGASSSQKPSQRNASLSGEKTPPPEDSMDADDHFQVQVTPPHLARSRKPEAAGIKPNPDDESTEDELQPSAVPQNDRTVPTETQETEVKKPSTRLGTLGRKRQAITSHSPGPVPSPQTKRTKHHNVDDSETASEADDEVTALVPDKGQPPSSPPPPTSKSIGKKSGMGLGRIGGPRLKDAAQRSTDTVEAPEEPSQQPPQPVSKRLGLIGKQKASEKSPMDTPVVENRGRSRITEIEEDAVPESKLRETSQERADRKREELKRELQKKAASGPTKKKR